VCEKLTMQKNLKNGLRIPLRADFKSSEGVKKSPDFDISRRKGGLSHRQIFFMVPQHQELVRHPRRLPATFYSDMKSTEKSMIRIVR